MDNSVDVQLPGGDGKNDVTCDYDQAVELTGHGLYNYILLVASCVIMCGVSLDMFGFSVVIAAARCDLKIGLTEAGMLASAPFAGVLCAFPWGYYADIRGRRQAILLSTSIGFLFAAVSSISMNWQFMLIVKILGCSFSTASFTLIITMLGESTSVKYRSRYLFIVNSVNLGSDLIFFGLAYLILPLQFSVPVPWLGILLRSWRLYTFMLALILGLGGFMLLLVDESPKFLANRGDTEAALEVLSKMYERNGGEKGTYPVKEILVKYDEGDELNADKSSSPLESLIKHTFPIFKPPLLWRTLQLFYLMALCCATNNVFFMWYPTMVNIFYNSFKDGWSNDKSFCDRIFRDNGTYIKTVDDMCNDEISKSTIYSGVVYGLSVCLVTVIVVKWASKRRTFLVTILSVCAVSCILVDMKQPIANIIFFTLLQFTTIGIGSVASYFVDFYPTTYRGMATSLGMMFARIASFVGVNIIGAVISDHCSLTFYVTSIFVFSGVIASMLLPPDTKT